MNIYCDMDGVLANFYKEKNCLERFENEKGFFKRLEPIRNNIKTIKELIKNGYNVYILSASPNEQADNDKKEWLKKYIPELENEHIIIIRNGKNKADYVKTEKDNILMDDYGKNIKDFENKGYKGYKIGKYRTIRKGVLANC